MTTGLPELNWYALRVFHNKARTLRAKVEADGVEMYVPMRTVERTVGYKVVYVSRPVIPSLVFVRTNEEYLSELRRTSNDCVGVYYTPGTRRPAVIPEREMEIFKFVTTVGSDSLEMVDSSFVKGDRVRVIEGRFKGAEGYISRVRNAKRLIVTIEGVAAIATTYIPQNYLVRIG